MKIRYDELRVNDVIRFHGANVRITNVIETLAPANDFYLNEKTIIFDIVPADEECIKLLGYFYSYGTYSGVGCLMTELVSR